MHYLSCSGLTLSLIGLLALGAAGPGYRLGLWGFQSGISLVKWSAYISLAAATACLAALALWYGDVAQQSLTYAVAGLVLSGMILCVTLKLKLNLGSVPYIHDITTDTDNPPLFVTILPLRADAENPSAYGGPELARQQKLGYPDLQPGSVNSPPATVFLKALQVAKDMHWEIVDSDAKSLRIEATDTTRWFGFKDDVVVRLTPSAQGSRIDVRSVSRVGKSDLGVNARRIEAYLARVTQPAA